MEDLENKIQGELKTLKDQLETIQTNSIKFTGVDDLRHETEERRNRLLLEQDDLADKKSEIQARVNQLQVQCDNLQVTVTIELSLIGRSEYVSCMVVSRWN